MGVLESFSGVLLLRLNKFSTVRKEKVAVVAPACVALGHGIVDSRAVLTAH